MCTPPGAVGCVSVNTDVGCVVWLRLVPGNLELMNPWEVQTFYNFLLSLLCALPLYLLWNGLSVH